MEAVIRRYSGKGGKELADLLTERKAEVEQLMRAIDGFTSYTLARTADGGFSVTVCRDKAAIDESVRAAKDWIAKNAASTGVAAPEVTTGTVILHI